MKNVVGVLLISML